MRLGRGYNPWWGPFLVFLGVTLYLTLYPFHFVVRPWSSVWLLMDKHLPWGPGHHSRLDIWSNILLFLPLGLSLGGLLGKYRRPLRLFFVGLFALGLSTLIEVLQVFLPGRDPALIDIFSNTLGAVLGGLGGDLFQRPINRRTCEGLFYLGMAFFLLYTPFYFTADWGEIKAHLKGVIWEASFPNLLLPALFMSLAGLRLFVRIPVWLGVLGLAVLLEGGRVLVPPVTLNPEKALLRTGLVLFLVCLWQKLGRPSAQRGLALFLLALAFLLEAWYPFGLGPPSLATSAFLPFFYYLHHFTMASLLHLLEIILLFVGWGLLARPICSPTILFLSAIGLVLLAEGGQAFIVGRVPDVTTALLAAFGVWLAQRICPLKGSKDDF